MIELKSWLTKVNSRLIKSSKFHITPISYNLRLLNLAQDLLFMFPNLILYNCRISKIQSSSNMYPSRKLANFISKIRRAALFVFICSSISTTKN